MRGRLIGTAGTALVLALTAAPVHAASTTSVAVADGAARWTTGGTVARDLARAGVTLRAGTVSQKEGRRLDLRVTGGTTRTIEHGFGTAFVLRKGRYTVRVTELRVRLGAKGRITGRLDDGRARTLFTLGRADLKRRDGIATSRSLPLRLTATAARALRKGLRVRTLRPGAYGTFRIAVRERPRTAGDRPSSATTTTEATTTTTTTPPASTSSAPIAGCPAPAAAPTGTPAVSGGTLAWGFKSTFRNYIRTGAAHGSITVSGGVTEADDRFTFRAPQGVLRADGTGDARYAGTVYFEGHGTGDGALLRLWLCRPRVVLTSATAAVLRADIASRTLEGDGTVVSYPDVALADLDLTGVTPTVSGGTRTWTNVPTVLRNEGAGAFAGFYQAGQELDPITFGLATATP